MKFETKFNAVIIVIASLYALLALFLKLKMFKVAVIYFVSVTAMLIGFTKLGEFLRKKHRKKH